MCFTLPNPNIQMVYELSILNIIILFGAIQGFLLALILLTTKRLKKKSNYFLALVIFSLALINFFSTMEMMPSGSRTHFSYYHPFYIFNLIPPSLYFFLQFLTNPSYKWKSMNYLFFLPVMIEIILRLYKFSFYLKGDLLSIEDSNNINFWINSLELIAGIFTLVVIFLGIKSLRNYEIKLRENYSDVETRSLKWLRNILIAGIILSSSWTLITISDYGIITFYLTMAQISLLGLSILIYWVGYSMIIRQELLETPIFAVVNIEEPVTAETSELSTKTDQYYEQLKELMTTEKVYQNDQLNMSILSEKTGLSNSYLSQIINQKEEKNFFDFVNDYRLKEVMSKMNDPKFDHYTILGLAQDAGFKSKSTFYNYFKKITGQTPSTYRKNRKVAKS